MKTRHHTAPTVYSAIRRSALVLLATLAVTSCGSSGDESSQTPVDTFSSAIVSAKSVVKVQDPVALVERSKRDKFAFIASRAGVVYRWDYTDTTASVLDISSLTNAGGERGLLGLAFRENNAYINYTNLDGDTVIAEYLVNPDGSFVTSSRRELLVVKQPYSNHNGGALAIGPDNMLYIAMGDGGAAKDPDRVAQSLASLLGKILRIDPTPSADAQYSIPNTNPFLDVPDALPEIWATGLRNPWRFSFDEDGNLWIADVGQDTWEEIDFAPATSTGAARGMNFGWSAYEGSHRYNTDQSATAPVMPLFEYKHGDDGCSVSGGVRVSSESALTSLRGDYVFSDYCAGKVVALRAKDGALVNRRVIVKNLSAVVAVQQTSRGVFVLSLDGEVFALTQTEIATSTSS